MGRSSKYYCTTVLQKFENRIKWSCLTKYVKEIEEEIKNKYSSPYDCIHSIAHNWKQRSNFAALAYQREQKLFVITSTGVQVHWSTLSLFRNIVLGLIQTFIVVLMLEIYKAQKNPFNSLSMRLRFLDKVSKTIWKTSHIFYISTFRLKRPVTKLNCSCSTLNSETMSWSSGGLMTNSDQTD